VVSVRDANVSLVLLSATEAATWLTVTDAVALAAPLVAVTVAVPFATLVIRPVESITATAVSDEVHTSVGLESA
tara:strand:+ start:169 stop:390 length:222 start_codon:yes stop_codon:yes gene_type:complete